MNGSHGGANRATVLVDNGDRIRRQVIANVVLLPALADRRALGAAWSPAAFPRWKGRSSRYSDAACCSSNALIARAAAFQRCADSGLLALSAVRQGQLIALFALALAQRDQSAMAFLSRCRQTVAASDTSGRDLRAQLAPRSAVVLAQMFGQLTLQAFAGFAGGRAA